MKMLAVLLISMSFVSLSFAVTDEQKKALNDAIVKEATSKPISGVQDSSRNNTNPDGLPSDKKVLTKSTGKKPVN